MNLAEYQEAAKRTLPDLGDKDTNWLHLTTGIITEFGEFMDQLKKNLAYKKEIDHVNLAEEWADLMWYMTNLSTIHGYPLIVDETYMEDQAKDCEGLTPVQATIGFISLISDFLNVGQVPEFTGMISGWYSVAKIMNIDTEKALENNIAKLKVRFPEKFTEENALNRNLEEERKKLEN